MAVTRELMHSVLCVTEAYRVPDALLSSMLDDSRRDGILVKFLDATEDIEHDGLTEYFQDEQGDREALKQDFTPPAVCDLVANCAGAAETYLDVCAGTGGLTISCWALNKSALFRCEEFSARTIPALLMNMALRNMHGEVVQKDVLTGEVFASYTLTPGERFSRVAQVDVLPARKCATCVQNPPYSLKWDGSERHWMRYGAPQKSRGDYAFVEYGLANVEDGAKVVAVLPHGVLFRGAAEGRIREAMLKDGVFSSVIGLPEKLFMNTGIPVSVLELRSGGGCDSVCVINADEEFEADGKLNVMHPEHVRNVLACLSMRKDVSRLCHVADSDEIEANGFNLNIPRYVDRYVEPEIPDLEQVIADLLQIEAESKSVAAALAEQVRSLIGTTDRAKAELSIMQSKFVEYLENDGGQLSWGI